MTQPSWVTPVIIELAKQSYQENSKELSLILADALEEAGAPASWIDHLRNPSHMPDSCGYLSQLMEGVIRWEH